MPRIHTLILEAAFICGAVCAQQPAAPKDQPHSSAPQAAPKEEAPPEEDESRQAPKEYGFNPLQAEKELKVGNFYFKQGKFRAAASRFEEALKWNPGFAEGYLRLGDAQEKLKDKKAAQAAYRKFVELAPEDKRAEAVKKKLGKG